MEYLLEWGKHFWKDTEYRVHEVTETFENDLRAGLGAHVGRLEASLQGSESLSVSDKKEIVHRAQEVVNSVQIQKLTKVLDILASDVFDDPQQRFYIPIDRLDENWVSDPLRYKLIRALIETVKDLQRITTAKIVVALRHDLLQRVFRETRDTLRFRSLGDEWATDYPELLDVAELLKRRPPMFPLSDISADQLDGYCLKEVETGYSSGLYDHFRSYYDNSISVEELRARVIGVFYEVGLVGLKLDRSGPISWSFLDRDVLRVAEVTPDTRVAICPMFYRVLGTPPAS